MSPRKFEESNLLIDLGDNQELKDNVWIDEKEEREESIIKFINNFGYDGYYFSEFVTSGDITIMNKVKEGRLAASSVECFYKNNEITKIKVHFEDGSGKFLDVILSDNVVKDYIFLSK